MVSSWTESEWDDEQYELVAAGQIVRNLTGASGEWLPDAMSDDADPTRNETGLVYVGKGPFTNWHKKAELDALDAYKKEAGEKANLNGVYFTAEELRYSTD